MGEFLDGELSQDPGTLKHHPALVLNADYRIFVILSVISLAVFAGCSQSRLYGA